MTYLNDEDHRRLHFYTLNNEEKLEQVDYMIDEHEDYIERARKHCPDLSLTNDELIRSVAAIYIYEEYPELIPNDFI